MSIQPPMYKSELVITRMPQIGISVPLDIIAVTEVAEAWIIQEAPRFGHLEPQTCDIPEHADWNKRFELKVYPNYDWKEVGDYLLQAYDGLVEPKTVGVFDPAEAMKSMFRSGLISHNVIKVKPDGTTEDVTDTPEGQAAAQKMQDQLAIQEMPPGVGMNYEDFLKSIENAIDELMVDDEDEDNPNPYSGPGGFGEHPW